MNILVKAYLDNNLGDDIMVIMLARELKNHKLFIESNDKSKQVAFQGLDNISFIKGSLKKGIKKWLDTRRRYDTIIYIGGSIFQIYNVRHLLYFINNLLQLMILRVLGLKILVVGSNTGPYKIRMGKYIINFILSLCSVVTLRDKQSYNSVNLLSNDKAMHYFPDIVLSYNGVNSNCEKHNNSLGISAYRSIIKPDKNYDFNSKIAEIANHYIELTGGKVFLFAFDSEAENDIASAYNIYKMISPQNRSLVEIIVYTGDVENFITEFKKCSVLIAVRFHSAILAMKYGIPFLPIIYSNKTGNLLEDIHYKGPKYYLDDLSKVNVEQTVEELINRKNLCRNISSQYIETSSGHLRTIRSFLESEK